MHVHTYNAGVKMSEKKIIKMCYHQNPLSNEKSYRLIPNFISNPKPQCDITPLGGRQ